MTRVLYIAPEYPAPGENAAQVRAVALLPRLRARNNVSILSFPPHGHKAQMQSDLHIRQVPRNEVSLATLLRKTFSNNLRVFSRYSSIEACSALKQMIDEFHPEVVHFDSIGTLALLDIVYSQSPRPKIIAHLHDAVSELYRRQATSSPLHQRFFDWIECYKISRFEREKLSFADVIIVDSKEDEEFLRMQTRDNKVITIPLGVDTKTFTPNGQKINLNQPAIVFSGSMAAEQSIDAAIFLVKDIMPLVWSVHNDCNLYIVGSSPSETIKSLQSNRVHVTGFVDDISEYLRSASVYVCPLRSGSGMRTRVLEALACGAITVATPMALCGLISPNNSSVKPWIEAETAKEFAKEINEAIMGKTHVTSRQAAEYVDERYSWDSVSNVLSDIYKKIVVKS